MESQSKSKKPLKLVCPCGYRKRLPEKFAGKKLVCPKCSTVLRIERLIKVAKVFSQCPYCKENSSFKYDRTTCKHCSREFKLPDHLATPAHSNPPVPMALAVMAYRKRRSLFSLLIFNLLGITLTAASAFLIWDKYGEQLGIRNEANPQSKATVPNSLPPKRSLQPKPVATLPPKTQPKLVSPSIEILSLKPEVSQLLDSLDSEVVGAGLVLEIEIRNLSPCEITKTEMSVELDDGMAEKAQPQKNNWERKKGDVRERGGLPKKSKVERKTYEFRRPLKPDDTRVVEFVFDNQKIAGANVKVLGVWARGDFDATEISKEFKISK